MSEYNILILSAGRRVELIECFHHAARKLCIKSNIVAGDSSETAPALYFADRHYMLPCILEQSYLEAIVEICLVENISLIIPTIDTDLILLSKNKSDIEAKTKSRVLISDRKVIEICRDKVKTQKFLEENNFGIPKLYTDEELQSDELHYPLFIKPKSGSSSVDTFKVKCKHELDFYTRMIDHPIVQDFIEGEEYTTDVFLDFESHVITIVPRLRMSIRSGEIAKGKIVKDKLIIDDITRLMEVLKPIGQITVQLMKTKKGIEYIEINPRFGGGAPMSIQSGADSCENLFRLLIGQELSYNENYRDHLVFLRFDQSICLDEDMEILK